MDNLKWPFPNCENVRYSCSQACQDLFVLSALQGKRNGTFLEIGAFDPVKISNTYLLESGFGWNGLSIDIEPSVEEKFMQQRKCDFVLANALKLDYRTVLQSHDLGPQIDYLSLDIDPSQQTLDCLKMLMLTGYRFSVVTFEHDAYSGDESQRAESRLVLNGNGYTRVCGNVSNDGLPFEDWYLDESVFSPEVIEQFLREDDSPIDSGQYVLKGKLK